MELMESGLSNRIEIVPGSAFEAIPSGCDAYIMKYVIHNWSDEEVYQIFQKCREALPEHGKLIIFEQIMLPGNEPDSNKWIDLHMMVLLVVENAQRKIAVSRKYLEGFLKKII